MAVLERRRYGWSCRAVALERGPDFARFLRRRRELVHTARKSGRAILEL